MMPDCLRRRVSFMLALSAACAVLSGCPADKTDSRIEALATTFPPFGDDRERFERFRRLPMADRLAVYTYWYEKPAHPPIDGLAHLFHDRPAEAFEAVIADLPPGDFDRFLRYMPIIVAVARARGFDVCQDPALAVLRERLRSYDMSPEQRAALGAFPLERCPLNWWRAGSAL